MIEEINHAIEAYHAKWHTLVGQRKDKDFFQSLKPTSIGWKAVDRTEFDKRFAGLQDLCDQMHLGWVNERWLATLHLRDELVNGVSLIKLMQRRPGSNDAAGLDHIDFLLPKDANAKEVLQNEADLKWNEEKNGDFCKWLSVWFSGTEAKLRADTVLTVCAHEMKDTEERIVSELHAQT